MRIRDLTLRTKVYGAFAIVMSLDILSGAAAIDSLYRVNQQAVGIREVWLPSLDLLRAMMSAVENYRIIEGRSLLTQDERERLSSEEALWTARDQLYVLRKSYERTRPRGDEEDRLIAAFDDAWRDYQNRSRDMLWHIFRGKGEMDEARTLFNREEELNFRPARELLQTALAHATRQGRLATETSKEIYRMTTLALLAISVCTLVLSWLLGVFIVRGVTQPVADLTGAMRRLSEDDLDGAVIGPDGRQRRDEIGVMSSALEGLRRRLLDRRRLIEDEKDSMRRLQTAERELKEVEKLAALGRMVAGVSHEINTPLGSAYTVATTLVEAHRTFAALAAGHQLRRADLDDFVERVGRASALLVLTLEKATALIRSFKQVAVDQTSSSRREFNLGELVRQVVQTTLPQFKAQPVQLAVAVDPDIAMDSYPGPLGQVLGNLLANALVHGLADRIDGQVSITGKRDGGAAVCIVVADNGAGILPEHRPHLFEPFFTTRFGKGGSGLGLNIVHTIVTRVLGGAIAVDSRPGEGASFAVTIPLVAPLQPSAAMLPGGRTSTDGQGG
jgi:signal transduction histidine kinase